MLMGTKSLKEELQRSMKTKISKILGVGLALIMVLSLTFALVPTKVQADEGNQQWLAQALPTNLYNVIVNGSNTVDVAVGPDGTTIYVLDAATNCNAAGFCLKSIDGGQTFAATAVPGGAGANPPRCMAVATDTPNAIAVVENVPAGDDLVHISKDGGLTWSTLPTLVTGFGAMTLLRDIMDVDVSPARIGAILDRDYLVAVADPAALTGATDGGLGIMGVGATPTAWTPYNLGVADYMACSFTPGYTSSWIIGAVQAGAAGTATELWNVQTGALVPATGGPVVINAVAIDLGSVNGITAADLAFPTNFNVTSPLNERFWASFASTAAVPNSGGVNRVDGPLTWALLTSRAVESLAFAGDASNTGNLALFAADQAAVGIYTQVWYTTEATTNNPSWYPSFKPPTGNGGLAKVAVAPDYAATSKVFVTVSGASESAFSISTDAGISYDQEAVIDNDVAANTVNAVTGIALTPDGTKVIVATDDNSAVNTAAELCLWESDLPISPFSWKRIFCFTSGAVVGVDSVGVLNINRATWDTNPEIYFAETPPQAASFYNSTNGGIYFTGWSAPVLTGAGGVIASIGVEGNGVIYLANGAAPVTNIYKSVTGGQSWGVATPANTGAIISIIPAGGGHILVGGTGGCSLSTDGGTSYSALQPGLPAAGSYIAIPDEGYADNNLVYAADIVATTVDVYRLDVVNGSIWEDILNPSTTGVAEAFAGIGMSNGALYAMTQGLVGGAAECDRTLSPHFTPGDIVATWGTMNVPAGVPAACGIGLFDVAQNKVYTSTGAADLTAYGDYMATVAPAIDAPVSGVVIPIDPVTGRADTIQVTWGPMGTSTGLATTFMFAIFESAQGFSGAQLIVTGNAAPGAAGTAVTQPSAPAIAIYPAAVAAAAGADINYTFLGGVEYGMMITAYNQVSGDFIGSQWSAPVFFQIETSSGIISPTHPGPELTSPTPGDLNVDPGIGFSWNPLSGTTEYEFILATDAALTQTVAGTPASVTGTSYGPVTLDYGTDYWYAVKASAPTSSPQSIGHFRTMDTPVEKYTCQYCGLTFDTRAELEAHIASAHAPTTPLYIWIVIIVGALLVIAVIYLIFTTRRT